MHEVPLDCLHQESCLSKFSAEGIRSGFGAAKDETTTVLLTFEEIDQESGFVFARAIGVAVVDVAIHDMGLIDLNGMRIGRHAVFDQELDGVRKRGGKQPGALALRGEVEDFQQFLFETHAEHFIGFIQNQVTDGVEIERTAFQHVNEPPGSGDDDVRGSAKRFRLAIDVVATTDDFDEDFRSVFGVAEQLFADLLGQLAGRGDNESLNDLGLRVDFREQRQAKGGGLAGAGLSLGDEITAILEQKGNDLFLDGCGLDDAQFVQGGNHRGRDSKVNECVRHGVLCVRIEGNASGLLHSGATSAH